MFYFDLSRLQPVATRVGYARIARAGAKESKATAFGTEALSRLSGILGRSYSAAKRAISSIDKTREVTVLTREESDYSGFHQGAGEITIAELVSQEVPKTSLVLIDEIETSLHPRAQRRLIRDLAKIARLNDVQFVVSTHSPYVLDELPPRARLHVSQSPEGKTILTGVTSHYAMTKMDEIAHHNVDVYVEDAAAKALVEEVLAQRLPTSFLTIQVSACGPASVAQMLGEMVQAKRFTRPTCVFLDGDQDARPGCHRLPGTVAPERLIFSALQGANYGTVPERLARDYASVAEAVTKAMAIPDHHDWVKSVSNDLRIPPDVIWQVMASEWVRTIMTEPEASSIVDPVEALLPT